MATVRWIGRRLRDEALRGPSAVEAIATLWRARRAGRRTSCGLCRGPLALCVGEAAYRWSCRGCGWTSLWFYVRDTAVHLVVPASRVFQSR
jgi:hypothetical protein